MHNIKLFLALFQTTHDTDKHNTPGAVKTVKCACISKLAETLKTTMTKEYSIIWKSFPADSDLGNHLGAKNDFSLPYFILSLPSIK